MATVAIRPNQFLSQILERICINLQLRPDQVERATEGYSGVTTWLGAEGSLIEEFSPYLFPQGSLRLDTTVRPIKKTEFDLDIVCKLDIRGPCHPRDVYELIWDRLQEHGTYRRIAERMPRCIRLNYSNDSEFHLDVVPAVPDLDKGGHFILIPDRPKPRMTTWKTSNPIEYSDWFESQTMVLLEKFARSEVEPMRRPKSAELKSILTKTVQLLKRWRDVRFVDDLSMGPPSIILTTLAGQIYLGQRSIVEAMDLVLEGLVQLVESDVREIRNPVNDDEIISEKWLLKPETYDAFTDAVVEFRSQWTELTGTTGIQNVTDKLKGLFGEPAVRAVKEASAAISPARPNGSTYINRENGMILAEALPAATLSTPSVKSRNHTFYGD
ncbi:MAG: nucleotidyltransferase [Isosphaeraceae bacterium]